MIPRPPTATETQRGNGYLAPLSTTESPRPRMRLLSFKPLVKNSLRGFCSLELPNGLRLIDCPVLVSHGKAWVSLPSKPALDQNGEQKRDANGKPAYAAVVQWRDRSLSDRFSDTAIELIRAAHPGEIAGAAS